MRRSSPWRRNLIINCKNLCCLFLVALAPGSAFAQAMSVIGGSEDAHTCATSAQFAASTHDVGTVDVEPCDRALESDALGFKDRVATLINRGVIRVANGDFQDGYSDYENVMAISPETPETYVNIGNMYLAGEKYETAVEFYSKSLELKIRQVHVALTNRGMAYEKLGNKVAAEADYRKAIEIAPAWPVAQMKLKRLLARSDAS